MALTSTSNRIVAVGDNSTVLFNYNQLLYDETHLQVYLNGVLQTMGYTVAGVPGTGTSVTFSVAPGSGVQVLMLRVVPITQLSVYQVGGAFPAATTEKNFDLAVMALQQFDETLNRAVTLPITSLLTATNLPDPSLPANYNRALKVKGDGTGYDLFDVSATPFSSVVTMKGDIAIFGAAAVDRLPVGANSSFVEADSTQARGLKWTDFVAKLFSILTTKGDLLVSTGATVVRKAVGANGTVQMARSASTDGLAYVAALTKAIYGLTYANAAGDVTNDLDIAAGGCMDATGAYWITNAALTKQSDVNWAVGNNAGGLDTGAVGNSDYYIWSIARSDTGVTDFLFSLSSTAPSMPTNYGFKRLIGWFKRVGGTIVAFTTYETEGGGIELLWTAPTLDIDLSNTLATRRTDAVKVPLQFSVIANINVLMDDATASFAAYVYCPDASDQAPSTTVGPLATTNVETTATGQWIMRVRTSATGLIAARASITVDVYKVSTLGFTWARRN